MVLVFWQEGDGLSYEQFGGNRRFGIRGAIGVPGYDDLGWFTPATDSAEERAADFAQSQSTRLAQEREEAERDRAEAQSRAQAALYDRLVQANEIATANEARSRAALEETLEQAARQAGYEQQQPAAPRHSAQEVENARMATERQHGISRQFQSREQAQPPIQAVQGGAAGSAPAGAQASTRDRADTCVGQPVTSAHQCGTRAGLKGRVVNSCAAPVDVRMCFMTATGWSCQVNYGLDPEDAWEPGDCGATGQVFRSVRYSDSNEPLASPWGGTQVQAALASNVLRWSLRRSAGTDGTVSMFIGVWRGFRPWGGGGCAGAAGSVHGFASPCATIAPCPACLTRSGKPWSPSLACRRLRR